MREELCRFFSCKGNWYQLFTWVRRWYQFFILEKKSHQFEYLSVLHTPKIIHMRNLSTNNRPQNWSKLTISKFHSRQMWCIGTNSYMCQIYEMGKLRFNKAYISVLTFWKGRESWLLSYFCLTDVFLLLMFCGSSSRCHGLVCCMWMWYFLTILTYFLYYKFIDMSEKTNKVSQFKYIQRELLEFAIMFWL